MTTAFMNGIEEKQFKLFSLLYTAQSIDHKAFDRIVPSYVLLNIRLHFARKALRHPCLYQWSWNSLNLTLNAGSAS